VNANSDIAEIEAAQARRRLFSLILDSRGVAESIDAWAKAHPQTDELIDASAAAWEVVVKLEAYGLALEND
jgi:hypothetical protein